jgi:phosphoglycolate phosphatase
MQAITSPTAILFDLDGTLIDPREGITRSIQYALEKLGRPAPESDRLLWCIGPPLKESFQILLDDTSSEPAEEALKHYRERYNRTGKFENKVYDGVPETLEALQLAGARLYIATSKPKVFADQIADHFKLRAYFESVYGSELTGERSDKAELIDHILSIERLDRQSTCMIGDRKHDIVGARQNDLNCIGVTYGYGSREELVKAGASRIIDNPKQLPALLNHSVGS